MTGRFAWLLCLLLPIVSQAALTADEIQQTFEEANAAYRSAEDANSALPSSAQANYQRAALRYEHLIREGALSNGRLYFNLANSFLGAGDYGRAILDYRRALLFLPGDEATERNLAIARQRRSAADRTAVPSSSSAGLSLAATADYQAAAFLVAWAALWLLLALRRRRQAAVAGVAAAALLTLTVASAGQFGQTHGVVTAQQATVRLGAGLSYAALPQPLSSGEEFRVLDVADDWAHVELSSGETAWLARPDFEVVEQIP